MVSPDATPYHPTSRRSSSSNAPLPVRCVNKMVPDRGSRAFATTSLRRCAIVTLGGKRSSSGSLGGGSTIVSTSRASIKEKGYLRLSCTQSYIKSGLNERPFSVTTAGRGGSGTPKSAQSCKYRGCDAANAACNAGSTWAE